EGEVLVGCAVVWVADAPPAVAGAAAARLIEAGARAIEERGAFRLGLSGGRTPAMLYQMLAFGSGGPLDWSRVTILFADERAVPANHRDSNYRLVNESLAEPLRLRPAQVIRMRGESSDLEAASARYESHLPEPLHPVLLGC